jgi:ABC-type lipopolysaccharide export system ATPase subunit
MIKLIKLILNELLICLVSASFKQSLDGWDSSQVTNMHRMFDNAALFDQPLDGWDTSQVTNVKHMLNHLTNHSTFRYVSPLTRNASNGKTYVTHPSRTS